MRHLDLVIVFATLAGCGACAAAAFLPPGANALTVGAAVAAHATFAAGVFTYLLARRRRQDRAAGRLAARPPGRGGDAS